MAYTSATARAVGSTGMCLSSCRVPLIAANSNLILATLVTM